nr:4Fe-4S dicluster domain-containing protein [Maliibacterium massiliense]
MNVKLENDVKLLKYKVLRDVAKLVFDDNVTPETLDKIPYEIIPGIQAQFRCCVYKEREILRQRTQLALGHAPGGVKDDAGHVVNVIPAACEGCPINRFHVTDNCQKCLAKKCMNACPFGAISMTGRGAYIDPSKCRECGRCASVCPYNAIADLIRPCKRSCPVNAISINDDDKLACIDQKKCISCGACMRECPFGAISDRSFMVPVCEALRGGREMYAIIAPALEGQFGPKVTMAHLQEAAKALGFADAFEVALGADAVAQHEARELLEVVARGAKMTSSCCPAFVSMIRKHFPQLWPAVSGTVSPMVATARLLKHMHPDCLVVFIGPCVAKKSEVLHDDVKDGADYALTTEEFLAMLDAKNIVAEKCIGEGQQASLHGKGFAVAGGVTGAVLTAIQEQSEEMPTVVTHRCDGAAECKKVLTMITSGKFDANFIEGMACEGGCVSGPAGVASPRALKQARTLLLKNADNRSIEQNVERYPFEEISLERKA